MHSEQEVKIIVDYLCGNPRNLKIAHLVRASWSETLKRVAEGFIEGLKDRRRKELPSTWDICNDQDVLKPNFNLQLFKQNWTDHAICLGCDKSELSDLFVGVLKRRRQQTIPSIPGLNQTLDQTLVEKFGDPKEPSPWGSRR